MMCSNSTNGVDAIARVVDAIATQGYAVVPEFVDHDLVAGLRATALRFDRAGSFSPAAVGRGAGRVRRADIRSDRIRWLDQSADEPGERSFRDTLEALRLAVNCQLQLGLLEFDGHYSIYAAGAGYARHIDRFRDDDTRVLSTILYLNDGWRSEDGGALRIHLSPMRSIDATPQSGTFVAFLSDGFAHEVLPACRQRLSIAGWFSRRG